MGRTLTRQSLFEHAENYPSFPTNVRNVRMAPIDPVDQNVIPERRRQNVTHLSQSNQVSDPQQALWPHMLAPVVRDHTYRGERARNGQGRVWIESALTDGQSPVRTELPSLVRSAGGISTAFGWGHGGTEPTNLALALLVDALGDRALAEQHCERFKRTFVATWKEQWAISAEEIRLFALKHAIPPTTAEKPHFASGQIVATPGVLAQIPHEELVQSLQRHLSGDWGELDEHDWNANESAVRDGSRLVSSFVAARGEKFWIITEADRSSTTVLLPEEY